MCSNTKPQIIIIGGGTAGVIASNVLGRKIGNTTTITLVSEMEDILYEPDNLFRVFDKKGIERQFRSLVKVVNKRVRIVIDSVTKVDPKTQVVYTKDGQELPYDYLLIASGAQYVYDRIPGYKEAAHHYHSPEAALQLRQAFENFEGGDIVTGVSDLPFKCPVAPLEFTLMACDYFKKRKMLDKVRIHYISSMSSAYSVENVSNIIEKKFEEQGIELYSFFNTESIDPEKRVVYSIEDEELSFDLLVMAPPHMGQDFVIDSGLGDQDGWVPVDRYTLEHLEYNNIYSIGDATDLPVSKSGSVAHHTARVVSQRIISQINDQIPKKTFNGHTTCFLMTSLSTSLILDFSYHRQPHPIGLLDILSRPLMLIKKIFPFFFFRIVLTGLV
jgi:sulfide:quinone oxidoreductase